MELKSRSLEGNLSIILKDVDNGFFQFFTFKKSNRIFFLKYQPV